MLSAYSAQEISILTLLHTELLAHSFGCEKKFSFFTYSPCFLPTAQSDLVVAMYIEVGHVTVNSYM